jgi:hypothetical protein
LPKLHFGEPCYLYHIDFIILLTGQQWVRATVN